MGKRVRNIIIALLFLSVSCGGSSGDDALASGNAGISQESRSSIGPSGGTIALPGIASIEFPSGAFMVQTDIILKQETASKALMDEYSESSRMSRAGTAHGLFLNVLAPAQPKKDATVHYVIPEEFTKQMDGRQQPALFAKYLQVGANDEEIDDFEPLNFGVSGNTIAATLPPHAFTNMRAETNGLFQAIIVLGSLPKVESSPSLAESFF